MSSLIILFRKARRTLSVVDLRRAARKPWRNLNLKSIPAVLTVVTSTAASSTPSENNVPVAAQLSPSALLPAGLPPGLSISNATGPSSLAEKTGNNNSSSSSAEPMDVSESSGGGGAMALSSSGGGGLASSAATPINNGDLQVVILD